MAKRELDETKKIDEREKVNLLEHLLLASAV